MASHPELRTRTGESGFTLVEVMVVVLILGVLLSIGIPTFLGARTRAQDVAATSNLDAVFDVAAIVSEFGTDYSLATPVALAAEEPTFDYVDATQPSSGPTEFSVDASNPERWAATVRSQSGTCFATIIDEDGRTTFETPACSGAAANNATLTSLASQAVLTDGFNQNGDGTAGVPEGDGSHFTPEGAPSATFTFSVLEPGRYRMAGTTIAPDGMSDSFWVSTSLDDFATVYLWDLRSSTTPLVGYVTDRGPTGYFGPVVELDLPLDPSFTVMVSAREDGALIQDMTLERQ